MSLNSILKVSFLAVSFSLLVSELNYSQDIAFTSWNFPNRYIRHRNLLCYIEPIGVGDNVGEKDATFRRVRGLAGKGSSFESVNFPGHFCGINF
jgi:Alpha-L-arabinofuranosidase B (ABFB) domain